MLETVLSLCSFELFRFRRHSLAFQFINFVDKPKFSYSFSVICLPYLFHSLVYQTLYNLKIRGMKEFSNGQMDERREFNNGPMDERRRGVKEFSNGLTNGATGILTAESLIAKDPSTDLPNQMKRCQLNYCT